MPTPPTILRLAQTTSITLSLLSSGIALAESFLLIPRLLESPVPLMLRQWRALVTTSSRLFRATTLPAAAAFFLLSWACSPRGAYLGAGLLCGAVGPYTWLVVAPTNRELECRAEGAEGEMGVEREASARWLVDHWGVLNLPRGVALGVAGVLGLTAAL